MACADEFLAGNAMVTAAQRGRIGDVGSEQSIGFRRLWMDEPIVREIGWELGPEQRFQEFGIGKQATNYALAALIQHVPDSGDVLTYVYAFHGG